MTKEQMTKKKTSKDFIKTKPESKKADLVQKIK